jgi:hypothetical protein
VVWQVGGCAELATELVGLHTCLQGLMGSANKQGNGESWRELQAAWVTPPQPGSAASHPKVGRGVAGGHKHNVRASPVLGWSSQRRSVKLGHIVEPLSKDASRRRRVG